MSYDIYFCRNEPTEFQFGEVVSWLHRYPHFKGEGESQLIYQNQDTGVYFLLEWSEPTQGQESSIPPGVYDTGLSLSLNYARPTFFAFETMPIVEALAAHFGFTMFDPQREPGVGFFSSEELVESWTKSNKWAVESLAKDNDAFFRLSPDTSTGFWTYMNGDYHSLKKELEGPDVFVPRSAPPTFRWMKIGGNKNEQEASSNWHHPACHAGSASNRGPARRQIN